MTDELRWLVVVAECQCVMSVTIGDEVDTLFSNVACCPQSQIVNTTDEPLVVGGAR